MGWLNAIQSGVGIQFIILKKQNRHKRHTGGNVLGN
jgi:hypothetical protein